MQFISILCFKLYRCRLLRKAASAAAQKQRDEDAAGYIGFCIFYVELIFRM